MTTAEPFELTFHESVERAIRVAARLLRAPLGAHTHEDLVSVLIEKEHRRGKSPAEIQEVLSGPGLYRLLANVKNDVYRWETAAKRGGREPSTSFDSTELFLGTNRDEGPEEELIQKEHEARMKDKLAWLIEQAELSETQKEILERDQKGYSNKRIARELGIDVGSVYARRSEALRKLAAVATRHSNKIEK